MYLLKSQENGHYKDKLTGRNGLYPKTTGIRPSFLDGLLGEEKPAAMWLESGLLVLLLHVWLLAYLYQPTETVVPAEPLIMNVSLIAATPKAQEVKTINPPTPKIIKPKPAAKPKPEISRTPEPHQPAPVSAPALPAPPALKLNDTPPRITAEPLASTLKAPAPKAEAFIEANYRANYGFNPKPEYPRIAKNRGWQGKVLLRVQVSAGGRSESIAVQRSSGHETLDDAAIEAVKKWQFIPAKRGDRPVASSVIVPIQFTLHD